jgi:hypothetical protein
MHPVARYQTTRQNSRSQQLTNAFISVLFDHITCRDVFISALFDHITCRDAFISVLFNHITCRDAFISVLFNHITYRDAFISVLFDHITYRDAFISALFDHITCRDMIKENTNKRIYKLLRTRVLFCGLTWISFIPTKYLCYMVLPV